MTPFDQGPSLPESLFDLELSDAHRDVLTGSAVDEVRILTRQYRTIPSQTAVDGPVAACLIEAGFAPAHVRHALSGGALVVPTFDRVGDVVGAQLRFDVPFPAKDGKGLRYTGAAGLKGSECRCDFGPDPVDADAAVWITEGVKKSDALAGLGLRAVAMPGVWNWKVGGPLHDDIDALPKGTPFRVVFDADGASNPQVANALEQFTTRLRNAKQSDVKVAILPGTVGDVPCKGVDDHIALGFTLADLEATLTDDVPRYVDVAATEKAVKTLAQTAEGGTVDDFVTDARLGLLVATELFPGRFRWANGVGWMRWDGCRWSVEGKNDKPVNDAVRVFLDSLYKKRAAAAVTDTANARERLREVKVLQSMLSRHKRDAVIRDASAVDGVRCDVRDFDRDPLVINTPAGLLDLRTGVVTPADPSNLVTKVTGTSYVPGARHADWTALLEAVPEDIRDWIQLRLGEALTGFSPRGVMFWLGGGRNGKSALLNAVFRALGDYAGFIPKKVLLGSPSDHPTEMMTLKGLRFAVMEELPEGKVLNLALLKGITDTDSISARHLYQEPVTFTTTHSLVVTSNYEQIVTDTDDGSWDRLIRVPFPFKFVTDPIDKNDRVGDPSIKRRVKSDPDGAISNAVFAWLVEGARRFLVEHQFANNGHGVDLVNPPRVQAACEAWRKASDPTYSFTEDVMVWDADGVVTSNDLLAAYNAFLAGQGMNKVSARTLKDRVSATAVRTNHARTFDGPVVKWVGEGDLSRAPSWLVPEPSVVGATAAANGGNPFAGGDTPAARSSVRVYTGLRFKTAADEAAASAADAAVTAASESVDLVHAAELITATAAASGGTMVPAPRSDVDRNHGPGDCVESGCTERRTQVRDSRDRDVYASRCADHVTWCGWDDRCKCLATGDGPHASLCVFHASTAAAAGDDECSDVGCDDDVYVPSVSPLCRMHLQERAEDAYGEDDYDAYLSGVTPYNVAVSRALGTGGDYPAAAAALARWLVDAALSRTV